MKTEGLVNFMSGVSEKGRAGKASVSIGYGQSPKWARNIDVQGTK